MKNKIITAIFVLLIAGICVATLLLPDRIYSSMENRYLNTKPEFSFKALLDGSYEDKVEDYLADQVVCKDAFVSIKTDIDKLLSRKRDNGVYFGKKGYYIKEYDPDYKQYDENLQFIKDFASANENEDITLLLAPNVQTIYSELLPSGAYMADSDDDIDYAKKTLSNLNFVDVRDILKDHKSEQIYFKTDHHWTQRGAFYAYTELADSLGLGEKSIDDYDVETVSEDFLGSLYSKAPLSFKKGDEIESFTNILGAYRVEFADDNTKMYNLYASSKLNVKDKYTYFLDGNHSFATISSNAGTGKKALIIKDSYSHALIPFLADDYDTIDVIDLRYYHDNVQALVTNGDYDNIIMIYNLDFLSSDTNFVWLES